MYTEEEDKLNREKYGNQDGKILHLVLIPHKDNDVRYDLYNPSTNIAYDTSQLGCYGGMSKEYLQILLNGTKSGKELDHTCKIRSIGSFVLYPNKLNNLNGEEKVEFFQAKLSNQKKQGTSINTNINL